MTVLDDKILPVVLALIDQYGRDVDFIVQTKTYDEQTGQTTYGAEPNVTRKATPPWPYDTSFRSGDVATSGRARIYVAGSTLTFTPVPGIKAIIDARVWTVTDVVRISSGEQDAAWSMVVER